MFSVEGYILEGS